MLNRLPQRVSLRLTVLLASITTVFIIASALFLFNRSYEQELQESHAHLKQLVNAVSRTAAISAYLADDVLASEVLNGLSASELVSAASLNTTDRALASNGQFQANQTEYLFRQSLLSPFIKDEVVGELRVQANKEQIESNAKNMAYEYVLFISFYSVTILVILSLLLNHQILSAVKTIGASLHNIKPGEAERLSVSYPHPNDEIGVLISDINDLLDSAQRRMIHERELRKEVEHLEQHFRSIFELTSGGLALFNQQGLIQHHNPAFGKIIGQESLNRLVSQEQTLFKAFNIEEEIQKGQPISIDRELSDHHWIQITVSYLSHDLLEVVVQDISERRHRENIITYHAERDPLTHLYNRRSGKQKVDMLLRRIDTEQSTIAVLMIDLDNFKPINDQHGHEAGDKVLVELAKKLKKSVRNDDIVIRWGGDEFMVVTQQSSSSNDFKFIAEKLIAVIKRPILIDGEVMVNVGASIGIALYPNDGLTLEDLTQKADQAMYQIKFDQKNGYAFYQNMNSN
jgi:diguanylate cyclase (GGDEF)-like protein/PAS domain S-box-containing protein